MNRKLLITGVIVLVIVAVGFWFYYNSSLCEKCGNYDEQIIGGCGGVYYPYWNECCDNWAAENDIVHAQCVGNWTVENNTCKWVCSS